MRRGDPIWWDGAPAGDVFPGGLHHADFAVIGGGLAGLSTAYHLLARSSGARVVVLEAERLAFGASGRTTGMLSPGVGQSVVALRARLGAARAKATYEATLRAVREAAELVASQRIDCEIELSGQLVIARSQAEQRRLAAVFEVMRELDLPVQALDQHEAERVVRLLPRRGGTNSTQGPVALRHATAGLLHPVKLVQGLAARLRAAGGRVHEGARVLAIEEGRTAVSLRLANGQILADRVIVAAAGYSAGLGHLGGRVLPVHLQALVTEPLDAEQRAAIGWSGREGILDGRRLFNYARLTRDDRIVMGGGRPRYRFGGEASDGAGADAALAALERELHAMFPIAQGRRLQAARGWTGIIGYTIDALPSIARAPGRERTYHLLGWCGHGVALAVAAGAWMTRLLHEGAAPEDLPWFRPHPPLVPTEIARWIGFQAAVGAMIAQDRWA